MDALQQALLGIEARDRIIAQLTAKRGARRPAPEASPEGQTEMPLSRWPLAEFAMGAGRRIRLPATLEDIAEEIGREMAVRLAEALRPVDSTGQPVSTGARPWRRMIYVPRRMGPDHPLVRILGWEIANRLQRSHTNMILEVPFCAELDRAYRAQVIGRLHADGYEVAEIADWVQMHPRSVAAALAGETAPEETRPRPRKGVGQDK